MKSRPSRSNGKATNSAAADKSFGRHSLGPCGFGSNRPEIAAFHIFAVVDWLPDHAATFSSLLSANSPLTNLAPALTKATSW